jgi:Zn-dependent protease
MSCPHCGAEFPPNLLVCPSCHALVHAAELKTLAANAEAATNRGDYSEALANWRRALELLPANSAQHGAITARVNDLVQRLEHPLAGAPPKGAKWAGKGGILGAAAIFVLTKAKLILLGLTKLSTFASMLVYLGVYWSIWGWQLALGIVLSIYIHEMGHVYQLARYGIRATAPMFIPGLGALIRQKQYPVSAHEDARVGLAGPMWGLGAAALSYALYLGTHLQIFAAIAQLGAWINLFNLMPVWQLDGSHAFRALSRMERAGIAAVMLAMYWLTKDEGEQGLLLLLLIVAAFRCFQRIAPAEKDLPIFSEFAFLVVALSLLTTIHVDTERKPQQSGEGTQLTWTWPGRLN